MNSLGKMLLRPALFGRSSVFRIAQCSMPAMNFATKTEKKAVKVPADSILVGRAIVADRRTLTNTEWKAKRGVEFTNQEAESQGIFEALGSSFDSSVNLRVSFGQKNVETVYMGNPIPASTAQKQPTISFVTSPKDKSKLFTIAAIDLDFPSSVMRDSQPLLHYLVTNVPGSDLSKGTTLAEWMPVLPGKDTGAHRVAFLIFEQGSGPADFSTKQGLNPLYTLRESLPFPSFPLKSAGSLGGRSSFPLGELASALELTPRGVAWFNVEYDESVSQSFKSLLTEEEAASYEQRKQGMAERQAESLKRGIPNSVVYSERTRGSTRYLNL